MRVLTLKTRTAANIKYPGYSEYTINFKSMELPGYTGKTGTPNRYTKFKRELREYIYIFGNLN